MRHFTLQLSAAHVLAEHEFVRSVETAVAAYWALSRATSKLVDALNQ
jgi:hypothetical protein